MARLRRRTIACLPFAPALAGGLDEAGAAGIGWIDETPPALALAGGALCLAGVYLARRPS